MEDKLKKRFVDYIKDFFMGVLSYFLISLEGIFGFFVGIILYLAVYGFIILVAGYGIPAILGVLHGAYSEILTNDLTVNATLNSIDITSLKFKIFDGINSERMKEGLAPLKWNEKVAE